MCKLIFSGGKRLLHGKIMLLVASVSLERVMNLGENRIEMRIPRSVWFP
jgi:hypothetical protein